MKYRVQNPAGVEVAQCVHAEDAAALVALYGDGARIVARMGAGDYLRLWTEGEEGQPAAESYDRVQEVCAQRAREGFSARGLLGPAELRTADHLEDVQSRRATTSALRHAFGGCFSEMSKDLRALVLDDVRAIERDENLPAIDAARTLRQRIGGIGVLQSYAETLKAGALRRRS